MPAAGPTSNGRRSSPETDDRVVLDVLARAEGPLRRARILELVEQEHGMERLQVWPALSKALRVRGLVLLSGKGPGTTYALASGRG
jgi:hypothetical protein